MNIPGIDVGVAVILFTVIVRLILYPLSRSALLAQVKMKEIEPEINKIKRDFKDDRQAQAQKTMELYKVRKIKPFSGVLMIIIQFPILIALISVFYKIIPTIQADLLYSFVNLPHVSTTLLGIDMTSKSLVLALLTGIIQFFQLHYSLASHQGRLAAKNSPGAAPDLASSMNTNMKYFMPIIAFASVYWLIPARFPQAASLIALYWSVSTLFTLGQELYVRKKLLKI